MKKFLIYILWGALMSPLLPPGYDNTQLYLEYQHQLQEKERLRQEAINQEFERIYLERQLEQERQRQDYRYPENNVAQ